MSHSCSHLHEKTYWRWMVILTLQIFISSTDRDLENFASNSILQKIFHYDTNSWKIFSIISSWKKNSSNRHLEEFSASNTWKNFHQSSSSGNNFLSIWRNKFEATWKTSCFLQESLWLQKFFSFQHFEDSISRHFEKFLIWDLENFSSDTWENFQKNFRHLENFIGSSKHLQLMSISKRTTEFFGIMNFLPPVYTNSQNQIWLHKIGRKDRSFPIFFGRTTKIGPILAVRVNEGLWKNSLSYLENIQSVLEKHTSLEFQKCWKNN